MRKFKDFLLSEDMNRRNFLRNSVFGLTGLAIPAAFKIKSMIDRARTDNIQDPENINIPSEELTPLNLPNIRHGKDLHKYITTHEEDKPQTSDKTKIQMKQDASSSSSIDEDYINFVANLEKFEPRAYYDLATRNNPKKGTLTIGYGFTRHVIPDLSESDVITKKEADIILKQILQKYLDLVESTVKVPLSKNQKIALVSFAYNIGPNNFKKSHTVKYLNQGNIEKAADSFKHWALANGRKSVGLQRRRQKEKELFLSE